MASLKIFVFLFVVLALTCAWANGDDGDGDDDKVNQEVEEAAGTICKLFQDRETRKTVSRRSWWRRTWKNVKPWIPLATKILLGKKKRGDAVFLESLRHIEADPQFWEREEKTCNPEDVADVEKADSALKVLNTAVHLASTKC